MRKSNVLQKSLMKNLILIVVLFLSKLLNANPIEWVQQNMPIPYSFQINNIAFDQKNNLLLIVGNDGIITIDPKDNSLISHELQGENIYSIYTVDGSIFLGSFTGKLYSKLNGEEFWTNKKITESTITKIIGYQNQLFFATSHLAKNHSGDGLYYSPDFSENIQKIDFQPFNNKNIEAMVINSSGRIYVGLGDAFLSGALYYSDDQGVNWTKHQISINGNGVVKDEIYPDEFLSLDIDNSDSLIIGITGRSDGVGIQFTAKNHQNLTDKWTITRIRDNGWFWYQPYSMGIFKLKSGRFLSTAYPSKNIGGIYISNTSANVFYQINQGMPAIGGYYRPIYFAENNDGEVYAIQQGLPNVWVLNNANQISLGDDKSNLVGELPIYPNPARDGFNVNLKMLWNKVELYDISGKKVIDKNYAEINDDLVDISNLKPGVYLVMVYSENKVYQNKLIKQ